ncbi:uncharacterized protein LOC143150382 [Ptiloglossa arizonensis]|uniref:uncharacterized protein LOC143150382 n=1 Tax=Ptiloglossa arizonensis TaxID=3350558 RepID=UPI003FA009BC
MKNGCCLNVSKDTKQRELLPLAKRRIIVQKDNFKPCTARVTEQTLQEFIVHPKAIKKQPHRHLLTDQVTLSMVESLNRHFENRLYIQKIQSILCCPIIFTKDVQNDHLVFPGNPIDIFSLIKLPSQWFLQPAIIHEKRSA